MKKICLFTCLFFMIYCPISSATNWQALPANDKRSYYFDTDSIKYLKAFAWDKLKTTDGLNKNVVTVFTKTIIDADDDWGSDVNDHNYGNLKNVGSIISKNQYDFSTMTCIELALYVYDKEGNTLLINDDMYLQNYIAPSTPEDSFFHQIKNYTTDHSVEIAKKSQ